MKRLSHQSSSMVSAQPDVARQLSGIDSGEGFHPIRPRYLPRRWSERSLHHSQATRPKRRAIGNACVFRGWRWLCGAGIGAVEAVGVRIPRLTNAKVKGTAPQCPARATMGHRMSIPNGDISFGVAIESDLRNNQNPVRARGETEPRPFH
jgi:hypothetical protein